jgi:hypothetical protein
MQNLKRLGAAIALTSMLSISVFAGEVNSPPCAPPEPGIMDGPPCSAAPGQLETPPESTNPGDIQSPPAADYVRFGITLLENAVFF